MNHFSPIDVSRLDPSLIVDIDLGSEETRQQALNLCAKWGSAPPFYTVDFGMPQAVVGRFEDIRVVYSSEDQFSVSPPKEPGFERFNLFNGPLSAAQVDGAEHTRIRRVLAPAFSPAILFSLTDKIESIIDNMLDDVEALGGEFDCVNDFVGNVIVRILLDGVLGFSKDQQAAFVQMNEALPLMINLAPGTQPSEVFQNAQRDVFAAIAAVINERRARPRKLDFISTMVQAQSEQGTLSDEEIIGNIFGICVGGLGTTATSGAAMLMLLCQHRDQFDQVIADPSLAPQVIEETLRIHGPGFIGFPRFATRDTEVGGVPILKGMPVLVSAQAGNYDPKVFPDPLKFDIHRKPARIATFGMGTHHCIGNRLARQAVLAILRKVCVRFPQLRLVDPDYVPTYEGMAGELKISNMPMHTGKS